MDKTYFYFGYKIEKTDKGYRIFADSKLLARKATLELAKIWVRKNK